VATHPVRTKAVTPPQQPMFVTWDTPEERALALRQVEQGVRRAEPVVRSQGSNLFFNIGPNNTSVRDGYGRQDYDAFRRYDALPTKPQDVIRAATEVYKRVGIIRNVVDLMADFACQGVGLVHPNERIEKWYQEWFRRVRGKDRSERFLNLFYRAGNVVLSRRMAKVPVAAEQEMRRAQAAGGDALAPDMGLPADPKPQSRVLPWRYTFRNPLALKVMSDELAAFVGQDEFAFAVQIPKTLAQRVKAPKTPTEVKLVDRLPKEVVAAIRAGQTYVELDPAKTRAFYYKKDDWEVWASPMVEAILSDIQVLQKMKLADLSALDGAISSIRVWKLGSSNTRFCRPRRPSTASPRCCATTSAAGSWTSSGGPSSN
jgi:hypothetical protein